VKAVKLIASLLLGLVLAFLLIGFFIPQVEFHSSIDVNAPVDQAFAVYTDESLMGEWLTGFVSIENISGAPLEVGSRWRLVFKGDGGEEIEMIEEVTDYEPLRHFGFVSESDDVFVDAHTRFFSDGGGGTRIEGSSQLSGKTVFMRSLLPLFKSQMQQRQDQDFEKLRELIESTPVLE
jgi:uncharacterized protein YndB with AHSA1/START domain